MNAEAKADDLAAADPAIATVTAEQAEATAISPQDKCDTCTNQAQDQALFAQGGRHSECCSACLTATPSKALYYTPKPAPVPEVIQPIPEADRARNLDELRTLIHFYLPCEWKRMFMDPAFIENTVYDGIEYFGLRDAPAAKSNHHHYRGGLVQHYLEMWRFFLALKDTLPQDELITPERILAGILLHDLSKAWCAYQAVEGDSIKVTYGKHPSDSLLTADQKSLYIVNRYGIHPDLYQLNALFNSEGGWAKSPPKWCSPLAKFLYLLDELSGNVKNRIEQIPSESIAVMGDRGVITVISGNIELNPS